MFPQLIWSNTGLNGTCEHLFCSSSPACRRQLAFVLWLNHTKLCQDLMRWIRKKFSVWKFRTGMHKDLRRAFRAFDWLRILLRWRFYNTITPAFRRAWKWEVRWAWFVYKVRRRRLHCVKRQFYLQSFAWLDGYHKSKYFCPGLSNMD